MPKNPTKLNVNLELVDENGLANQVLRQWVKVVSDQMPIVGTGSPEGVLEAPQYALYIDETTPSTPVSYRKMLAEISGDRSKGWAAI